MFTASIGISTATKNASMVAPVPKRRATMSSFATEASLATEVRMTIVVAARKTWRFVEPVVKRSHGFSRILDALFRNGTNGS